MNFATLHFDTYKVVTLLKERGFTKKQAEGIMEAVQEVTISGVATKDDLHDLDGGLRTEIHKIEAGLHSKIQDVRTEIQDLRTDTLKFMLLHSMTIIGVMVALFALFGNHG